MTEDQNGLIKATARDAGVTVAAVLDAIDAPPRTGRAQSTTYRGQGMSDLQKLIEAVEAGKPWTNQDHFLGRALSSEARRAFLGSLDAAKRLHDALFQGDFGWSIWRVINFDGDPRRYGCNLPRADTAYAENPARAWLLAQLKALQAKEASHE